MHFGEMMTIHEAPATHAPDTNAPDTNAPPTNAPPTTAISATAAGLGATTAPAADPASVAMDDIITGTVATTMPQLTAPAAAGSCRDDSTFLRGGKAGQGCDWIADKIKAGKESFCTCTYCAVHTSRQLVCGGQL